MAFGLISGTAVLGMACHTRVVHFRAGVEDRFRILRLRCLDGAPCDFDQRLREGDPLAAILCARVHHQQVSGFRNHIGAVSNRLPLVLCFWCDFNGAVLVGDAADGIPIDFSSRLDDRRHELFDVGDRPERRWRGCRGWRRCRTITGNDEQRCHQYDTVSGQSHRGGILP